MSAEDLAAVGPPRTRAAGPLRRLGARAAYAWDHSAFPPLAAARGWHDTRLRSPVGVVSSAGPHLPTIAYAGPPHGVVKIHQLLEERREALGGSTTERERGGLPRGELPAADLVAVGCTQRQAERWAGPAALTLPYRVHLVVDLDGDWRRALSRRERQWFAAARRSRAWALEQADDDGSFAYFYDRMHEPTMRLRHGERARSEARERAYECLFRAGVLVFVTLDGVRVAGALCRADRATLTIRLVGVADGARQHYTDGALRAADHLLLEWAAGNGYRHVDFGGVEPFLSQGIFQWKRKFGPRAVRPRTHLGRLALLWCAKRDTPPVRDFLVANPVLELAGDGGFCAVYFHDAERPARTHLSHVCANVQRSRVVDLDVFLAGLPGRGADP
ncbi:hypothetical protein [Actinokineospora sp. NPDC004072]